MMSGKLRAAVIGGGMSGMCAAIMLADSGIRTTIYERQDRIGKKLLLTGNGRCNISNKSVDINHYLCGCPAELGALLEGFDHAKREAFFERIGLAVHAVRGGLYPQSNQASSVLDALRYSLREAGVEIISGSEVLRIGADKRLTFRDGSGSSAYDFLLLCGGGAAGIYGEEGTNAVKLAKQLGHSVRPTHPGLCALKPACELKAAAGVRCAVSVMLHTPDGAYREAGELQINKDSLSGIPIMQLSRYVMSPAQCSLTVDFMPWLSYGYAQMFERAERFKQRSFEEFFAGWLNKKLALWLIKEAGLKASDTLKDHEQTELERLFSLCRGYAFKLKGMGSYREAQLMCGGVPLSELSEMLESKYMSGVYLLGELLDVNGECGGYNLHFAMACAAAASEGIKHVSNR